jgi:predicted MFS family arabinose efflux permease
MTTPSHADDVHVFRAALALALGAAVSLGLARFSYALLLPPMRADLHWSYFTAGAMNTVNAAGYLIGALMAPRWLANHDARRVFLAGMAAAAVLLALHGLAAGDATLLALRAATGIASAATFVGGGLLAARLGVRAAESAGHSAHTSSLVLGLYYGGTGAGIVASALLVPAAALTPAATSWRAAWWLLALTAAVATAVSAAGTRGAGAAPTAAAARGRFDWRVLRFGLAAYLMFGLGYIGYMTFVVTLLREQGLGAATVTAFYVVLGVGVMASPWLWAGLLQRHRGGVPIAWLNGLLAVATAMPVLVRDPVAVFASGALFGGVFLSVVASTTAMVRHNLEPSAWPVGIAAFTIVFAAGQIVGPGLVGWVADTGAGLPMGFVASAFVLALGSALGVMQRALPVAGT